MSLKKEISRILKGAVSGRNAAYTYKDFEKDRGPYIRWGLVEKDIHLAIDRHLSTFCTKCGESLDKDYKSDVMDDVLKYNNIQHKFLDFSLKAGPFRKYIGKLIILVMRNKWVNKKISKGFS